MIIRLEEKKDFFEVEALIREAFWNVYKPGCSEHFIMHNMRTHKDFIPQLSFVMQDDSRENAPIIGQNVFFPAEIACFDGKKLKIATMGPIGIHPDYKRKGFGKMLLDYTLQKAKDYGFGAVCFEGNIDFYGKSGFDLASKMHVHYHGLPPEDEVPFFLCKELVPGFLRGIEGTYASPDVYFADDADVDAFDANFAPKQKLKLPGQLF